MSEKLDQNKLNTDWNYHPKIPLENYSIFRSPPKLIFFKSWILRNWLHLSEKVILNARVQHGRDPEGYSSMNARAAFPFNIVSSSVTTGYNREVVERVTGNIEITNLLSILLKKLLLYPSSMKEKHPTLVIFEISSTKILSKFFVRK